jgi:hypothetical protein
VNEFNLSLLVDLLFSYNFLRHRRGAWLLRPHVGINNLFDESYNSNIHINAFVGRYLEPALERNIYAGLVIRFTGSEL